MKIKHNSLVQVEVVEEGNDKVIKEMMYSTR
jgi:hypothetical protein